MCAVSMIYDNGNDWLKRYPTPTVPYDYDLLKARVTALEEAMKAAKEYDKVTGQPNCDDISKKAELEAHAKRLGIKIQFPT